MEIEENNPLIDHIILSIYGLLKNHMKLLLSTSKKDEEIYNNVKLMIIKCLKNKYLKMNNPSYTTRKTISDSLTLLILSGVFYHWPTCIQDLINESIKENWEFCYIVLRALGSIDLMIHYNRKNALDEYDDSINISQKEKKQIKDKLIDNKDLVINFILNIYKNINNIKNENLKKIIINQLFETTRCWTSFELNLLKNNSISEMIYSILNSNFLENPDNFSEMICESIYKSNNSKVFRNICAEKNATPEMLSKELSKSIDYKEKEGIDNLLNFLFPKLEEIENNINNNSSNNYYQKLFLQYAKILASIIEHYIYFFFNFKDKKSELLFRWFRYFLKCKKRNISWLFFEGLDEMREFINNFYRFCGLSNQQKIDFVNYLMDIAYGVMENCSYKKLDVNDMSLLEQEIICKEQNLNLHHSKTLNENKIEDVEGCDDLMDIDVNQYRSSAESVFYNIFFILVENFQDPGTSQFLSKLIFSLPINEINDPKNLNDQFLPIKIDVVLYVITSIIEIFEVEDAPNSINIIHNLIKVFLGSKIIFQNQRIFIDFLILLNKFSEKLILQQDNFNNVIQFLLLIAKSSNNSYIIESCYIVLLNLCDEINDETKIDNSFIKEVFNIYQDIYNKYQYPKLRPLENVIDILLKMSGISSKRIPKDKICPEDNNNYNENLKYIIQQISLPINTRIKTLFEKFEKNNQDKNIINCLRLEIVKGFTLQGRILASLKEFSIALRNDFLQDYLNQSLDMTKTIFEIFQDDKNIMNPLIDFFKANAQAIGEHCHSSFNLFNNIMINYYLSSDKHYKVIDVLRLLYLSLIITIDKNDKLYMTINKFILDQYNLIMTTFIDNISKEKNINSSLKDKILVISDFHFYLFPKLYINISQLINNNDLLNYYNLVENVVNFFVNCITLFKNFELSEPIDENTLISVIKSFNSLFINIHIPKNFIAQNNNNNSCMFINIITSLWNIIYFKQFNSLSRKELINCFNNSFRYDFNLFIIAFEKCLSQSQKFSPKHIKSIIEYIQCFQDNIDSVTKMIELVIENSQRNAEIDARAFDFFFLLVSRKKLLKKNNK